MIIIEEFLDKETCSELIEWYETKAEKIVWAEEVEVARLYENSEKYENIKKLFFHLNKFGIENLGQYHYIQNLEIAKRDPGIGMTIHTDYPPHAFTLVCFLNDNFSGGEAIVQDTYIEAEIGKAVYFRGNSIEHGVNVVRDNPRYALLCWWTQI